VAQFVGSVTRIGGQQRFEDFDVDATGTRDDRAARHRAARTAEERQGIWQRMLEIHVDQQYVIGVVAGVPAGRTQSIRSSLWRRNAVARTTPLRGSAASAPTSAVQLRSGCRFGSPMLVGSV